MPPSSNSLLQRTKLVETVSSRVSGLELDKKFKRCLIWIGLETLNHLFPEILEHVGTATARFVAEPSVRFRTAGDATCSSILEPTVRSWPETSRVLPIKPDLAFVGLDRHCPDRPHSSSGNPISSVVVDDCVAQVPVG